MKRIELEDFLSIILGVRNSRSALLSAQKLQAQSRKNVQPYSRNQLIEGSLKNKFYIVTQFKEPQISIGVGV